MQQVVAGTHHIAGDAYRLLSCAAGLVAADPGHSLIAVVALGVLHHAHRILALRQVALHFLAFSQGTPAALVDGVGHLLCHGLTG
ncbi:hypothetical protein D3C85_1524060 [compost metagenome]